MFTFGAKKVEARAGYASGSLTTAGSRSSPGSASPSSSSASSSSGSRGGIVLPMMVTMLQSTNQVETFSAMRAVISAPVGRRDVYGRMLARELGISKASALLPVIMPTQRAQNLHKRKGRPQSHSPSKDSDRELERGSNRAAPGTRVDGQHPGIESGYVMEGDVLLKVLRPLQSPALGLAFDGLCPEHADS